VFQGVVAQRKPGQRVDLPGEQAVAGQAELDEVRQLGFRQGDLLVLPVEAVIDQQPSTSSTSRTVIFQPSKWVMVSPGENRTRVRGAFRSAYWRVSPVAG
jgi:hypothetical protein